MKTGKETRRKQQNSSRLDMAVIVVGLLWLATSLLLLILSRPGAAHALQPRKQRHHQFARVVSQATARASFIY
jgi:hypothetical protein